MIFRRPLTTRVTTWHDVRGSVVQVSVAVLDPDTWDPLAHVTEPVGPFDDLGPIAQRCELDARALADGQYRGQQALDL